MKSYGTHALVWACYFQKYLKSLKVLTMLFVASKRRDGIYFICCIEGKVSASLKAVEECTLKTKFPHRILMTTALNTLKIILFYVDLHFFCQIKYKSVVFTGICF